MILKKIQAAITLAIQNFTLYTKIILTIWLPLEIVVQLSNVYFPRSELMIISLVGAIFFPLSVGAILAVVFAIERGRSIDYQTAMSTAWNNWGTLVNTRIYSGIYILLSFLALIVPGIVLSIQYSFIEPLIIDEGIGKTSMKRSQKLTKGLRWSLFFAQLIMWTFIIILAGISLAIQAALGLSENFIAQIVFNCVMDAIFPLTYILSALFYLDTIAATQPASP
jgi:hypothetical protein